MRLVSLLLLTAFITGCRTVDGDLSNWEWQIDRYRAVARLGWQPAHDPSWPKHPDPPENYDVEVGMTSIALHERYGVPDRIQEEEGPTQVWVYADDEMGELQILIRSGMVRSWRVVGRGKGAGRNEPARRAPGSS